MSTSSDATGPAGLRARIEQRYPMLVKEVSVFGMVGGVNFCIDLATYQVMYAYVGIGALYAKVVSTAVTSTLAYFMHRHWSFSHRAYSGLRREYVLFIALSVASLLIGLAIIGLARYGLDQEGVLALQVANVISIGLGVIFRFWAYKRFVFLPAEDPQKSAGAGA